MNVYRNIAENESEAEQKSDNLGDLKSYRNRISMARIFYIETTSGEFMIIDSRT